MVRAPGQVVYKYPVPIEDSFKLKFPKGAEILSLQAQRGAPCLWALVNPSAEPEERCFLYVGTGHEHPLDFWKGLTYRGTVQIQEGALVFHLFEETE